MPFAAVVYYLNFKNIDGHGAIMENMFFRICCLSLCAACLVWSQGWTQWGQNARHTGVVDVSAQRPETILAEFQYDALATPMRADSNGNLLTHYMAPIVDGEDVFMMTRTGEWRSCQLFPSPCGTELWKQMQWSVTRFRWEAGKLERKWTADTNWKPAPADRSGWEPVFHPVLAGSYLYMPASGGALLKIDRETGERVECVNPFDSVDSDTYVSGPVTANADGDLIYNTVKLNPERPWTADVEGAWLVRIGADGSRNRVAFRDLITGPPGACNLSFNLATAPPPWPPAPDALPPLAPCGGQRPGLNVAPAVAADGTIITVSRAHFNASYSYLVAVNPDLTVKWTTSLRDQLRDGCGVMLPPNGSIGGCREGTAHGVDPTTNQMPAGQVLDQSTASPAIAPDGAIFFGVNTAYNSFRGHLMKFSPDGEFRSSYDFGWDTTPAIFAHDGTYSVVLKDNHYGARSYCGVDPFCIRDDERYDIVSLTSELQKEWSFVNTNSMACERLDNGTRNCVNRFNGFEWCVNMVAMDRDGVLYANSEDGNLYAIDRGGKLVGNIFLKVATGASYTPLAIGADGRIYTQNAGTLFVVGALPAP